MPQDYNDPGLWNNALTPEEHSDAKADFYLFTHISSLAKAKQVVKEHVHELAELLTGNSSQGGEKGGAEIKEEGEEDEEDEKEEGEHKPPGFAGVLVAYVAPKELWQTMIQLVGATHSGSYASKFDRLQEEQGARAQVGTEGI